MVFLGLYFQKGERTLREVCGNWNWASGLNGFRRHWRAMDIFEASGATALPFSVPHRDAELQTIYEVSQNERSLVEEGISRWARDQSNFAAMGNILRAAFWTDEWEWTEDWLVMDGILKMPEGDEKKEKMEVAQKESPLFFAACLEDPLCGM